MVTSMAKKENKDKILEYLKSHSQATEDEIAKDLNINVVEVLDSLITMEKEGLLKSIPVPD
jgi:predicted ArsR family transcriptional regulator